MYSQNNHESMKTVVETFLTEETMELIYDNEKLDQWNSYVEALGLEGQTKIKKVNKSPIPFMHLKKSYVNICKTLCPREVDIKNYNISPIPVEILDLVALSVRENYFAKILVWYDDKSPDPFVVGVKYNTYYVHRNNGSLGSSFPTYEEALAEQHREGQTERKPYGTQEEHYLIGKWADVKRSWKELKEMASERFVEQRKSEYQQAIRDAKRGLEDLETEAFNKFN